MTDSKPTAAAAAVPDPKLVWYVLLGSVVLYAAVPLVIARDGTEGVPMSTLIGAIGFALAAAGGSFALRRIASARLDALLRGAPAAGARTVPRLPVPTVSAKLPVALAPVRAALQMITWVACEAIALVGFVLYLGGASANVLWAFCAGAALLLFLHAPGDRRAPTTKDLARADVKIG